MVGGGGNVVVGGGGNVVVGGGGNVVVGGGAAGCMIFEVWGMGGL